MGATEVISSVNHKVDFSKLEYDVTDVLVQCCHIACAPFTCACCIPGVLGRKKLILEEDEAVLKTECCICTSESREIYSDLQGAKISNCLCFICLEGVNGISLCPGMGCDQNYARTLREEILTRALAKGEKSILNLVRENNEMLRQIMQHLKLDSSLPMANVMDRGTLL